MNEKPMMLYVTEGAPTEDYEFSMFVVVAIAASILQWPSQY